MPQSREIRLAKKREYNKRTKAHRAKYSKRRAVIFSEFLDKHRQRLGGKCNRCGSDQSLCFDHIDCTTKKIDVSLMQGYSKVVVLAEIDKCQLLCRSCNMTKYWDTDKHLQL